MLALLASDLLLGIALLLVLLRKSSAQNSLLEQLLSIRMGQDNLDRLLREELKALRTEQSVLNSDQRRELNQSILGLSDSLKTENRANREELSVAQNNLSESLARRIRELSELQQVSFETLRGSIEARLEQIRANNETKLEEMRRTVDEKLHETLEKRLGEHFNQVSERLEKVHRTMGEVQGLTKSVGKLEQILGNVKNRGVMGEVQLGNLLQDLLLPSQYVLNFKPRPRSNEAVEFAIKLPGPDDDQQAVYLPMDSKFPIEDYQRLLDAYDSNDLAQIEASRKAMADRIKGCARDIRDKYINPPSTTDFGLLFLPFEGLYAEALRITGLFELLIRDHRVVICGPTTTAALINSLQMGFRTLAIQKKTAEAWKVLTAVKHDFGKFARLLDQTQTKLSEASKNIERATDRTRQIEKKLSKVQELPAGQGDAVLDLDAPDIEDALLPDPSDSEI